MSPTLANDPLDAFRRGLEDGAKLRELLQGRAPGRQRQRGSLEANQQRILRLQASGALNEALSGVDEQLRRVTAGHGRSSLEHSATLGIKAGILQDLGQYERAIASYRQAASITRSRAGANSQYYARDLINLADLLRVTGQFDEASRLLETAVAVTRRRDDDKHMALRAAALVGLGEVRRMLGRNKDAKSALAEAIKAAQSLPQARPQLIGAAINNLGLIQAAEGNAQTALDNIDKLMPFLKGTPLDRTNLGHLLRGQRALLLSLLNRHDEAIATAREGVTLAQRIAPTNATLHAKAEAALGVVLVRSGRAGDALLHLTSGLAELESRGQTIENLVAPQFEEERYRELYRAALAEVLLSLKSNKAEELLFRALDKNSAPATARALRQMSIRAARRDEKIAHLVRKLQDVERTIVLKRRLLYRMPLRNISGGEANLRQEVAKLLARHKLLAQRIRIESNGKYELDVARQVRLSDVRNALGQNEVLIYFIEPDPPMGLLNRAYVWVIEHDKQSILELDTDSTRLREEARALRCGLDRSAWTDPSNWSEVTPAERKRKRDQAARRQACMTLTGQTFANTVLPPFDGARSHRLYRKLFGKIEAAIAGKNLIVVPSKSLSDLPLHVLVTEPSRPDATHADRKWLGLEQPITVLPAVSSLVTLRKDARTSRATEPFAGFGNPILTGGSHCRSVPIPDRCPQTSSPGPTAALTNRLIAGIQSLAAFFRDGQADVEAVRKLCPLPDTAHELKCVAESLGVSESRSTVTGKAMAEAALKRKDLSRYRVLHFATHGLLSGEMARLGHGRAEPALVFTPPTTPSEVDDGLLTASEIASLKLDADWVVLSACNTAAAQGEGADALSGLARAFFYAGARALLVSHWQVNSYAATMLTSTTFAALRADPGISRAEALRRAMNALASDPKRKWAAHPSIWAPFVVVGD